MQDRLVDWSLEAVINEPVNTQLTEKTKYMPLIAERVKDPVVRGP
jgi:hypothetical protein